MIGKILAIAGVAVGFAAMALWYFILQKFLKANDGKRAEEVEPKVKRFMTGYTVITVLVFAVVITGVVLTYMGI